MKFIDLRVPGNISGVLTKDFARATPAIDRAMRKSSRQTTLALRRHVQASGLGRRLPRAIRGIHYPNGLKGNPAAFLHVNSIGAQKIFKGFQEGAVVRPRRGRMLAIPTKNAARAVPGRGRDRRLRLTPEIYERAGGTLDFAESKDGTIFLFDPDQLKNNRAVLRLERNGPRTRSGNFAKAVMFILVPHVRLPRKITAFERIIRNWPRRMAISLERELKNAGFE